MRLYEIMSAFLWIKINRYETDKHELVLGQILCLEASSASSSSPPVLNKCHEMGGDQEWKHRNTVTYFKIVLYKNKRSNFFPQYWIASHIIQFHFQNQTPIYNLAAGTCLHVDQPKSGSLIKLGLCSNDANGSWDLVKKPLWSRKEFARDK